MLLVTSAALLVVGAGTLGLFLSATWSIRANYHDHLLGLAQTAAALVDPQLHQRIRRPEDLNGELYAQAVEPLRRMRRADKEILDIYTIVRDGGTVRFVLDAAEPGSVAASGIPLQAGVWQVYENPGEDMLNALGSPSHPAQAVVSEQPETDAWGTTVSALVPLRDASGQQIGALGIDVDAGTYLARLATARNWALLGLVPAGLLILSLGYAFARVRRRGLEDAERAAAAAAAAKHVAEVLASERARLDALIEGSSLGTWEWDIVNDLNTVNDIWAGMLGYTPRDLEPLTSARSHALMHPADVLAVRTALTAHLSGAQEVFTAEFRMRHADGHWVWIFARGNVLERDAQGDPVRMAGIHVDVSARKQAELALQDSENKFRSLFELSPVGIALNDLHTGQFLEVNDALVGPTGYSREELLRMSYWDLTPSKYARQEVTQIDALDRTDQYGPYEKEYRRKDGSTYPVLLSGIRMHDRTGREVIWSIVQDISVRKAMESELTDAARRDRLTGLANRPQFLEFLTRAINRVRAGEQRLFAVLFLDFDRFKLINDTLGHQAGDELLRQISVRLKSTLRAADVIAPDYGGNLVSRFGGDEFLVLINELHDEADAQRVAERLLNALAPSYDICGSEVHSSASIGIVTSAQCISSAEDVVRNADVAMYEAKRSGRACAVVFNEAMHTRLTRHVAIEASLRRAIGTPELHLVYQPIVELATGAMVSAEALVRWEHPTLGTVSPGEFIPVAEESGLIIALDHWVLTEACRQLAAWRRSDPQRAPRTMSVNISRVELALGRRLLEQIRSTLEHAGLPPHCLQVEVTEREFMRNSSGSRELMHELQELGVKLAMDDFGTGATSLAFLRDYPFSTVKIDRSFVRNCTSSRDVLAVIQATVTLVEKLGMTSVAEGVEFPEQALLLKSLGCHLAQGFHFSRPVPPEMLLDCAATVADACRIALQDPTPERVVA